MRNIGNFIWRILAVILLLISSGAQWTTIVDDQFAFPTAVAKFYLTVGQTVRVEAYFDQDVVDIDILLYREGQNIAGNSYVGGWFGSSMPQVAQYTATSSKNYFAFMFDYLDTSGEPFYVLIKIGGIVTQNISMFTGYDLFTARNFDVTVSCKARITINETQYVASAGFFQAGYYLQRYQDNFATTSVVIEEDIILGAHWKAVVTSNVYDSYEVYDLYYVPIKVEVFTGSDTNYNQVFNCLPDCSGVTNGFQSPNEPYKCACKTNFVWDQESFSCLPECFKFEHAYPELIGASQCACLYPYKWNLQNTQCELDCSIIQNSKGVNSQNQCKCEEGYVWSQAGMLCSKETVTILGLAFRPIIALAIITGVLFLVALILFCRSFLIERDVKRNWKVLESEEEKRIHLLHENSVQASFQQIIVENKQKDSEKQNQKNLEDIPQVLEGKNQLPSPIKEQAAPEYLGPAKKERDEKFRHTTPSFFGTKPQKKAEEEEDDKDVPIVELRHSKQRSSQLEELKEDQKQLGEEERNIDENTKKEGIRDSASKNIDLFEKELALATGKQENKFEDFEQN